MTILIIGATGQVGSELLRQAPSDRRVVALNSSELDITDRRGLQEKVTKLAPAIVINASAYTAVDKAEKDVDRAFAINAHGVHYLAECCNKLDIPLFHISTDYVFSGEKKAAYSESDFTEPLSIYGHSKLEGERLLMSTHEKAFVLRTSWIFSAHRTNFVKTMLKLGSERSSLNIVADQWGCPTSARSIADTLWSICKQSLSGEKMSWGVFHYCNADPCTWYDFAEEIFSQYRLLSQRYSDELVLNKIATAGYPTPAKRPQNSVLECRKIVEHYNLIRPSWKDELNLVINELIERSKSNAIGVHPI